MAGRYSGFDAAAFRTNIRFAMNMGAPPDTDDQALFLFPETVTANEPADQEEVPFDPQGRVTKTSRTPVRVPVAVAYFDAQGNVTAFGVTVPSRAEITLLDEDYAKVKGCSAVVLGGERFVYRHEAMPEGLFEVGVHTLHFVNENDL